MDQEAGYTLPMVLFPLLLNLEEPKIVVRPALPYAAVRTTALVQDFPVVLPKAYRQVVDWLKANGAKPAGPPMVRYRVIDMKKGLQIDIGFPTAKPMKGGVGVICDALPAGRYVSLYHKGGDIMAANGALQDWAKKKGLQFKVQGDRWKSRAELNPVDPGDTPDASKWETEILIMIR